MEELVKKMKKMTTAQLLAKVEKSKGEEKEAILKVLELRGQDVENLKEKVIGSDEPVVKVYEMEQESPLTPDEQALVDAAEAKFDAEQAGETKQAPSKASTLLQEAENHLAQFTKGSAGMSRIIQITRGRKLSKMSNEELKLLIAVPFVKGSVKPAPAAPKAKTETKPKTEKPLPAGAENYLAAGTKVNVIKSDETVVAAEVVSINFNEKGVPFYKVKSDGKTFCRIPKFVSEIVIAGVVTETVEEPKAETAE